ncbi:alpha/beta hydrolase [Epilithonimonas sp.]|uniref:alpha/beta hydrolase n=1 Tax=Epilithonimonas sp. TaxID=2894511 RepID=UPI00289A9419|nr:alpha/beta hydrolase [Epilithonimonas sp.]
MKTIKNFALLVLMLFSTIIFAQLKTDEKPTIIFVHGIWADGSSWSNQITALQAKGYPVMSVQNQVASLAGDVEATKKAISLAKGKVILVGHSWGGIVITQAGNDPKVAGLVYIAALVPDLGESISSLSATGKPNDLGKYLVPVDGTLYLSEEGVKNAFAQDLPLAQQKFIYATQTPGAQTVFGEKSGEPAWKTKPSWYVVAKSDRSIDPDLERTMAKRAKSKITEIEGSHVVMLSHPKEVLGVIEDAIKSLK